MSTAYRPSPAQWRLAALILALAVGVIAVRLIRGIGLGQTAAFYLGIPTVFALVLALSAPSKNLIGMTLRGITLALLLAMPVLGEGFVCVLIAAPLCYAVGLMVAALVQWSRRGGGRAQVVVVPALLLLTALEGVTPALTLPDDQSVTESRVVAASPDEVRAALARPLRFADHRPGGVLALGFPAPIDDAGGLDPGDQRSVRFAGAHHRPPGVAAHHWGEHASALQLRDAESGPEPVTFATVADHTPLASWLAWRTSEVHWRALPAGGTEISWTLRFTRRLAPGWYFGPIEQFVAGRAADYLLDAIDLGAGSPPR